MGGFHIHTMVWCSISIVPKRKKEKGEEKREEGKKMEKKPRKYLLIPTNFFGPLHKEGEKEGH